MNATASRRAGGTRSSTLSKSSRISNSSTISGDTIALAICGGKTTERVPSNDPDNPAAVAASSDSMLSSAVSKTFTGARA